MQGGRPGQAERAGDLDRRSGPCAPGPLELGLEQRLDVERPGRLLRVVGDVRRGPGRQQLEPTRVAVRIEQRTQRVAVVAAAEHTEHEQRVALRRSLGQLRDRDPDDHAGVLGGLEVVRPAEALRVEEAARVRARRQVDEPPA